MLRVPALAGLGAAHVGDGEETAERDVGQAVAERVVGHERADELRGPGVVVGDDGVRRLGDGQGCPVPAVGRVELERCDEVQRPADDRAVAGRSPHHGREDAVIEPVPRVGHGRGDTSALVGVQAVGRDAVEAGRVARQPPGHRHEQRCIRRRRLRQRLTAHPRRVVGPPRVQQHVPVQPQDRFREGGRHAGQADRVEDRRTPLDLTEQAGLGGGRGRCECPKGRIEVGAGEVLGRLDDVDHRRQVTSAVGHHEPQCQRDVLAGRVTALAEARQRSVEQTSDAGVVVAGGVTKGGVEQHELGAVTLVDRGRPQPARGRVDRERRHRVANQGERGAAQHVGIADARRQRTGAPVGTQREELRAGGVSHGRDLVGGHDGGEVGLPQIMGLHLAVAGVRDEGEGARQVIDVDRLAAQLGEGARVGCAQHGERQQCPAVAGGQLGDDLFPQELAGRAHRRDEGEADQGGPAGEVLECVGVVARPRRERARLFGGEGEAVLGDVEHGVARAESRQRERQRVAAGEDQMPRAAGGAPGPRRAAATTRIAPGAGRRRRSPGRPEPGMRCGARGRWRRRGRAAPVARPMHSGCRRRGDRRPRHPARMPPRRRCPRGAQGSTARPAPGPSTSRSRRRRRAW